MNHEGSKQVNKLTGQEIAKHNNRDSCWVIVNGKACTGLPFGCVVAEY